MPEQTDARLVRMETLMTQVLAEMEKMDQTRDLVIEIKAHVSSFPQTLEAAVKSASQSGVSALEMAVTNRKTIDGMELRLRELESQVRSEEAVSAERKWLWGSVVVAGVSILGTVVAIVASFRG